MGEVSDGIAVGGGSPTPRQSRESKIESLELLRGAAACWVLLHHAKLSVDHFVGSTGKLALVGNGHLGVDFFFILSGFIIAYSSNRLVATGRGVRDYFRARLIRIYVPYLPVGIGMYLLYVLLPGLSEGNRDPGLLTSLALLPSDSPPALSVAWTLVHEMIFYVLFSVWFLSRRIFAVFLVSWVCAILLVFISGLELGRFYRYFLSPLNLYFVAGVATFWLTSRYRLGRSFALASIVIGLLVVVANASTGDPDRLWVAGGLWLMTVGAVFMPSINRARWGWALALGTASYSIYLVHNPLQSVLVRIIKSAAPDVAPLIALAVLSLTSLLCAIGYWYFYERPGLAVIKVRLAAMRGRTAVSPQSVN